jgi:transcriptional regulator GlxA family with amidase domain
MTNAERKELEPLEEKRKKQEIQKQKEAVLQEKVNQRKAMVDAQKDTKLQSEKISLKDICDSGNIGTNLCTQLFKKYTNMSPIDYLRCYRIEKSLELLRDTDMTITEIAYATGFNGASYYAETFRKYAGYTPTQIRKRMKEQGYEIS